MGLPLLRGQSVSSWFIHVHNCIPQEVSAGAFPSHFVGVPRGAVDSPFVVNGNGALRGLDHDGHVQYAIGQPFPKDARSVVICDDLVAAVNFELENDASYCDNFRLHILEDWVTQAKRLATSRVKEAAHALPSIAMLVGGLHCPLVNFLVDKYDYDCKALPDRCRSGFQFAGDLDRCNVQCILERPVKPPLTVDEVRADRRRSNAVVLSKLKQSEHSGDLMKSTLDDVAEGMMSAPVPVSTLYLDEVSLTRRLAVREERAKGWRTRAVDHFTESWVNPATHPADKVTHDTVDVLVWILCQFLAMGALPQLWKRDIRKAFRKLPIAPSFHDLCWVVFMHEGIAWASCHYGMPFGSVSAVYAWHRMGGFVWWLIVKILKIPLARYVDDFFGASKEGISVTGGVAVSILSDLLGIPCDDDKSVDYASLMVVLGIQINIDFSRKLITMVIQAAKALAWRSLLESILLEGCLDPGMAAK